VAEAVYILCTITSAVCAILLLRGYLRSRTKLLFWSSICFIGLAVHNALLFVDLVMLPDVDLFYLRTTIALLSLCLLLYGLIWEHGR
jgi:hypothetical protein